MVFGWDQSQSTDELKIRFGVVSNTGSARLLTFTLLQDSSNYYEVDYPGFYAPSIKWGDIFWTIFSYVRAFLALLQLYVIFIRPGTTKEHRLSLMWFGSTIISIQLLFFIPYIAGNFGGAIDEIHFGMMAANRRVFGYNLSGYRMSSNYLQRSAKSYMNKWAPVYLPNEKADFDQIISNFTQSSEIITELKKLGLNNLGYTGFVPNPILENVAELYIMAFAALLPIFCSLVKNENLLRLSKGIKSGAFVSFFVPILTSCLNNIVTFFHVWEFDAFSIISAYISLLIIGYMMFEFITHVFPSHPSNKFRNSELGLIDFDCHPDSSGMIIFRRTEFWLSSKLPFLIFITANIYFASALITWVAYGLLMVIALANVPINSWRIDMMQINVLKFLNYLTRFCHLSILLLYWAFYYINGGTPLMFNRIFTIAYVVFLIADLLTILATFALRVYYEFLKIFWPNSQYYLPLRKVKVVSPEAAMASIGMGRGKRTKVGGHGAKQR